MRHIVLGAAAALGLAAHLSAQQPAAVAAGPDNNVTVVGCVVKGDGGYVLSNVAGSLPAAATGSPANTVASASTVAGRVFYWLDDDDDIDEHAGRRVEVSGKLEKDIDQAVISVEREGGMLEVEFKPEGDRKVTVKLPDTSVVGTSGAATDRERDHHVVIRKIDVKSVKVLASTCQ